MSTVLVLTPVIISSWPAIAAAAAGAASALGFAMRQVAKEALQQDQNAETMQNVELELDNSEILAQGLATDQKLVLTKGNVEIVVERDARGRCKVCASGVGRTKAELKQTAEQFAQKLSQCFIYDKVMRELKQKNFQVVNEEIMHDESIRIHVRRWTE